MPLATDGSPAILYQDDSLIAVDKPAGLIVHSDGTEARTLTGEVRDLLERRGADASQLQPLMRLDRDTTGVVLFSLRKEHQAAFDRLIAEQQVEKRYLAVCEGEPRWERRTFAQPIGRDRHDSRKMRVSRTGKPSLTRATVLECAHDGRGRAIALLDVELETGRKHQIRVHLSAAGLPLAGDALYNPHARAGEPLMLHAYRMTFEHPLTGESVVITSPYPARFARCFPQPAHPLSIPHPQEES